jgi:hypothetical protein
MDDLSIKQMKALRAACDDGAGAREPLQQLAFVGLAFTRIMLDQLISDAEKAAAAAAAGKGKPK